MQKPAPVYSSDLVFHPEHDAAYKHFENAAANPFQPNAADLSRVNAWWLAEAALLTYWSPADAIPIYRSAGFDCTFVSANGTDCYVASQKDFLVVAFRGTQPGQWQDVLADANLVQAPWDTGRVHLGFKNAFNVIRPQLDPLVADAGAGPDALVLRPQPRRCPGDAGGRSLHSRPRRLHVRLTPSRRSDVSHARSITSSRSAVSGTSTTTTWSRMCRCRSDTSTSTSGDSSRRMEASRPASRRFPTSSRDLIGQPRALLESVQGLSGGTLRTAPVFLLDHMPKAYAIWTWNDHDAHP